MADFSKMLRKLRAKGKDFVDHGTPVGVRRQKAQLGVEQTALRQNMEAHSALKDELTDYKQSLDYVTSALKKNPMRSRAGGIYQMSGHSSKLPSAYSSEAAQNEAKRLAMKKLRSARNGPHAAQIVANHDQKALGRINNLAEESAARVQDSSARVANQADLLDDVRRRSRRNVMIGTSGAGAAAGGAAYAATRNKEDERDHPLMTRQKLR